MIFWVIFVALLHLQEVHETKQNDWKERKRNPNNTMTQFHIVVQTVYDFDVEA